MYADRCVRSTIEQALENISSFETELFSNHLAEDIIAHALSTIVDNARSISTADEKYRRKLKKKAIQFENMGLQQTSSFNHPSSRDHSSSNEESVDSLVNTLAQKIYLTSFDELRQ